MKICVLVKEVPDAAVEKKLDPSTGRMDRSGEKNLNPYDTHAIEAAMQIKEGGAVPVEEIVAVTMGPGPAMPWPRRLSARAPISCCWASSQTMVSATRSERSWPSIWACRR